MKIAYITTDEDRYLEALLREEFDISIVIVNNSKSKVINYCRANGLNLVVADNKDFKNRKDHDLAIMNTLDKIGADLVILGGYRRLIKNKKFLSTYGSKMVNIHNSFLPNFPGAKPHEEVFLSKIGKSGYTIHLVDEVMDRGEIIFQEEIDISDCQSAQEVYDKLVVAGCNGLTKVVRGIEEKKLGKTTLSIHNFI